MKSEGKANKIKVQAPTVHSAERNDNTTTVYTMLSRGAVRVLANVGRLQ